MIKIEIRPHFKGWIKIELDNGESELSIFASRLSDFLTDLVVATRRIADGEVEIQISSQEEPGEYRWLFDRIDGNVQLRIISFKETFSGLRNEKGTSIYTTNDTVLNYSRAVLRLFDKLKYELGKDGYLHDWTYEFPEKELETLRKSMEKLKQKA